MNYFRKMCGCGTNGFCVNFRETFWSFLGSLAGITAVGALNAVLLDQTGAMLLIGSFGASAVLLYGAPTAPLSQPRNLLGGHVLSALVGVACAAHLGHVPWLAAGLAVSTAIALMHLTGTLHPPGGATALIAVIGGEPVRALGYLYALVPALAGALVLLAVALLVNNIPKTRQYPVYWY
ncbi:HPP family protein [Desulfocurvus vexinensis]|uniref:HPP family protein n=1 Tax=Desulfocurvus vexinensis TaxID=399548 RepID=UPI0004900363|nr:HPP family protein [Desulfocurvus vexinensis]